MPKSKELARQCEKQSPRPAIAGKKFKKISQQTKKVKGYDSAA